jgi:hypothetical protein
MSSPTLREKHILEVPENRMLRISGPKREKIGGWWRNLHNEQLPNLYSSPNIIMIKSRRMRLEGHVACMGEVSVQVVNPEVKRPLRIPWCVRDDNIKMDPIQKQGRWICTGLTKITFHEHKNEISGSINVGNSLTR